MLIDADRNREVRLRPFFLLAPLALLACAPSATGPSETGLSETGPSGAAPADAAAATQAPLIGAAQIAGAFTIERGACFGPCPVYSASVFGDDRLVFSGERFTARDGVHEKRLSAGAFARLVEILKRNDFAAIETRWPDAAGLDCPEPAADMPTVVISIAAPDYIHSASFYEGCSGDPATERIAAIAKEADAVLALSDWIGPRDTWLGGRKSR